MSPKQTTLSISHQLKASRGVSAKAALNMPGPTGCPPPPIFGLLLIKSFNGVRDYRRPVPDENKSTERFRVTETA
jgi:hypothetical protein